MALVAHLYYLTLGNKTTETSTAEAGEVAVVTKPIQRAAGVTGKVYFINADSVGKNYKYIEYMNNILLSKRDEIDNEIKRKEETLINLARDFEDRARYFTSQTQYTVEADKIKKEEQKFQEYADRRTKELLDMEENLNKEFMDNLKGRLIAMNNDLQGDFIFNYNSMGGNLLICNDSLDITAEALQGLNADFESKYGSKKAEKKK